MSSLPFRTAICALGLSFLMSVMLLVPNPQRIRAAFHARRNPPAFPHEQTLVAQVDETAEEAAGEESPAEPIITAKEESRPVQVASSDLSASLGVIAKEIPAERTPSPQSTAREMPESGEIPAINIPVPEPVHRSAPEMVAQVTPEQKIEPAPVPQHPIPQPAQPHSAAPPAEVPHQMVLVTENRPHEIPSLRDPSPRKRFELSDDDSISITEGSVPERWNFQFTKTPVHGALKVLAQYQGFTVIVDDRIEGDYSGEFIDSDPAQAFAVVVKTFDCKVSRRGKVVLLSKRN